MSDFVRYTSRSRCWRTWAGDIKEIHAIADIFENAAEKVRNEILEQHQEHEETARFCTCLSDAKSAVATARISEGSESISGSLHAVVAAIDRRTFKRMTFKLKGFSSPQLELTFDSELESGQGLTLQVSSSWRDWVRQTFTELSDEIDKGVPRWHFLRTGPGLALITLVGGLAGFAIALPMFNSGNNFVSALGTSPIIILMILSPLLAYIWAFPGFEITHEGGTTTGARRLAFICALLLSIPIGIVINLIT
ncbi:hypothetical protein [Micromonospora sp. NPDC005205]|uniref:hypothetical protein n=1 Tax=Micromonospora sp. NPDC005205 TaxID=3156714 RepID=UPI0033BD97FC